ncbi:MAG TPA: redoxin domain-containing protein [Actinomycetota bacterium]|nr:redoxin domain-containing protein [Actinomycetota bacterium]
MKSLRNVIVLVVAVAFVAAACGGDSPEASGDQSRSPSVAGASSPDPGSNRNGKQNGDQSEPEDLAPDFSVETFDGDTFKLSDHRGTPVVLNFWESW